MIGVGDRVCLLLVLRQRPPPSRLVTQQAPGHGPNMVPGFPGGKGSHSVSECRISSGICLSGFYQPPVPEDGRRRKRHSRGGA